MAAGRIFRYLLKSFLSQPVHERELYSWIRQTRRLRFAELGLGRAGGRAVDLLNFAQLYAGEKPLEYLGIDQFEGRPLRDGISLKEAHKMLNATGAKAKLVPGDAVSALPRAANAFRDVDLMIISADQDVESVRQGLMWIPRMLNETSLVLWEVVESDGRHIFGRYQKADIEAMLESGARKAA